MNEALLLSRLKLQTFLACQRRFQLKYVTKLVWPAAPLTEVDEQRQSRGQLFHQVLERHFLGLPLAPIEDKTVRNWWLTFQNSGLALPDGRFLPELTLTIPVGRQLLNGRFDLLVLGENEDGPFAHLFDWKTGKAQTESDLRHDWQTKLYLALVAESAGALRLNDQPLHLTPEQIAITYWYTSAPDEPQTIHYNTAWHQQNWMEIVQVVAQIGEQLAGPQPAGWPLTTDLSLCARCLYQVYCGRQAAGSEAAWPDPEAQDEPGPLSFQFEPDLP